MALRLILVLAFVFSFACAARSAGAASEASPPSGAEASKTGEGDCEGGCKHNLLCRDGKCMFEPIPCADDPEACPSPYACVEASCKLPGAASCRYAGQCASMKCHLGLCVVEL